MNEEVTSKFEDTVQHVVVTTCPDERQKLIRTLRSCLEAGADVNGRRWGYRPLYEAIIYGDIEVVNVLLEYRPSEFALMDSLIIVITEDMPRVSFPDRLVIVRALLGAGANPEGFLPVFPLLGFLSSDNDVGDIKEFKLDVLRLLLDHGANPNVSLEDSTCLIDVTRRDNSVAVGLLLAHGADVHARGRHGMTALFFAHSEITAKMLLNAGAEIDARDDAGRTPLNYHGHWRIYNFYNEGYVKTLLAAGACIDFGISDTILEFQRTIVAERKKRAGRVIKRALWKRVQLRRQMELLDQLYRPGGLGALRAQERFEMCIKNLHV